jgi:hypothetical protein
MAGSYEHRLRIAGSVLPSSRRLNRPDGFSFRETGFAAGGYQPGDGQVFAEVAATDQLVDSIRLPIEYIVAFAVGCSSDRVSHAERSAARP